MFRMTLAGDETVFVRRLTGEQPWDTLVQVCLDQLVLSGEYSAVRSRVAAVLGLLDDIAAHPDRWEDLCWQHGPAIGEPRSDVGHDPARSDRR